MIFVNYKLQIYFQENHLRKKYFQQITFKEATCEIKVLLRIKII